MQNRKKTLFFFASEYPYGSGETFIENEIPYLSNSFDSIVLFTNSLLGNQTRTVPDNVSVLRIPYDLSNIQKVKALVLNRTKEYIEEKKIIEEHFANQFSPLKKNIILSALYKSRILERLIDSICIERKIERQDLYLYSYWMNDMASGIAYYRKKHPEVRAFCRVHGWDLYFERHPENYLPLRKFISDNLNAIFCISETGKKYLESHKFIDSSKLFISRLGVRIPDDLPPRKSSEIFHIISCSSIIPLKRIDLMIKVMSKLNDQDIKWTHIGDGPLREELEMKVKEANLNFNFIGQLNNSDVYDFYRKEQPDLFVNLSDTEGLPVSIMETLAFGIPVLARDVGGIKEIVIDGHNGILINSSPSTEDIVSSIKNIQNMDSDKRGALSKNSISYCNREFNALTNYTALINVLNA